MNKHFFIAILILVFLVIGTSLVVFYGRGYRLGLGEGKIELNGTGLLVAKSRPDGASVFINGDLITATDNTINLPPGEYEVKILKEGYFPWQKTLNVQEEVVSSADALLIPSAPKLESITDIGVLKPVTDPSGTRIAFTVASQSAKINGVYVFDMSTRPVLTLQSSTTQITDDTQAFFSESDLSWSPDGKQLVATIGATTYLLDSDKTNPAPQNVTSTLPTVEASWKKLKEAKEISQINSLPKVLRSFAQRNFEILAWSPDDTKILYRAATSAEIPVVIKPRLIGTNPTQEERTVVTEEVYVYDIKEDRNYKLDSENFKKSYYWLPDSNHILFVKDKKISIMDYDGLNSRVVYAGPFAEDKAFPWPDGSRIVILTNLGNEVIQPNLYTISLK